MHYTLIADDSAAAALAVKLRSLQADSLISIDTEFVRIREYYPRLGLLQVGIKDDDIYLIDPLSCTLREVLPALLQVNCPTLAFAAVEDLQILFQYAASLGSADLRPRSFVDLQQLAAFAGHSHGRGLSMLVHEFCGVELEKSETMSDWLQRPLTDSQLEYASLDVAYLPQIYTSLYAALDERLRRWFALDMEEMQAVNALEEDPELCYRHVKTAGCLCDADLTVLQYICAKRLHFAREHDVSANLIITSRALCELARRRPRYAGALADCGVKWGAVRDYGKQVLRWIAEAERLPVRHDLPLPVDYFAHGGRLLASNRIVENASRLKVYAEQKAKEAGLMPQLMRGRRSVQEFYTARYEGREGWLERSWRRELLGSLDEFVSMQDLQEERQSRMQMTSSLPL